MRITTGTPITLSDIAKATDGKLLCPNKTINCITTDSRCVFPSDLFWALDGENFNGEDFALEAKEKGGFTISKNYSNADVFVSNTRQALLKFAHCFNKNLPIILYRIGITGSVGKSTTKEFLSTLLSQKYNVHKTDGNQNNEIGMPMTLLSAKKDCQALVIEMGMNHLGEIKRLSECLTPNIGIITNVGRAHIGNLGSRENIAKAKMEIADGIENGVVILPYEEPLLSEMKRKLTFSTENINAHFYLEDNADDEVSIYNDGILFCKSKFVFPEDHIKKCLIAACSAAILCGLSPYELSKGISSISRQNARQIELYRENLCFYTDFYNASPESVTACINTAKKLYPHKRKSLLLGDMLELGDDSISIHREIGKQIDNGTFINLFLFGNEVEEIKKGALLNGFNSDRIFLNRDLNDTKTTAEQIRKNCQPNEMIFMKASRKIMLERVIDQFRDTEVI